jgi:zinc and cadmium transporter
MSTLGYILAACIGGSLLSLAIAALVAFRVRARWIPTLVSFAVGALLGAVFLDILPHVFEETKSPARVAGFILFGILVFFLLEKLLLWRHHHHPDEADGEPVPHHGDHDHGRSGWMIVIGDAFHNFTDGVIIASAFMADTRLGVVTALAIIAHEIPQEIGDFLILLHSGFGKRKALAMNLVSGPRDGSGRAHRVLGAELRGRVDPGNPRHRRGEHDLHRGRRPHPRAAPPHRAQRHDRADVLHRAGHRGHLGDPRRSRSVRGLPSWRRPFLPRTQTSWRHG